MSMWSEWEPPEPKPTECLRRAALWLGGAYAATADLVLLGLPVVPDTFVWHTGLRAAVILASAAGLVGFFAPGWRDATQGAQKRIVKRALLGALGIAAAFWLFAEPPWIDVADWEWCYVLAPLSLAGALSALATAAWPRRGWRRWRHHAKGRLALTFAAALGARVGPHYRD